VSEQKEILRLKQGDIAFFREIKLEPRRNAKDIKFTNGIFGFGLMLGAHAPGMAPLTENSFMTLMGQCGFLSFDNLKEFIGEEEMNICIKKFQDKYHPKVPPIVNGKDGHSVQVTETNLEGDLQ
jgi:hypothetical protein